MTIPIERTRAVQNAELFLLKLTDPKLTPRVPRAIRREAAWLLKHYPHTFYLEEAARKCPNSWGVPGSRTAYQRWVQIRKIQDLDQPKVRRRK